jgi:outer membrane protein W
MDSMSVKVLWQKTVAGEHAEGDEKETSSLSGSGFSAKGLFDYDLGNNISIRGLGGIETFNVSGGSSCGPGNDSACTSKIIYLTGDGMARYLFSHKELRPWGGLGLSLLFPLSASGTALDPASVGSTWMLIAGGGVDWFINPKMYVPISIEYGMFPPTDQVKAHWIAVRAGFAVPY